ncbi:MAG: SoxR reducing system RseC family protein [Bacteroidota bacterium]|nr:SoxR reducing system RseC family protein [Bacteroidota bacterium]
MNMQVNKPIEHKGRVESIRNGIVKVNILVQSACASCQVKGACSVSDMENKSIDIRTSKTNYKTGEMVNVQMQQSQGFKALFLGYVLPFILVMLVLGIGTSAGISEGISGLSSLIILLPYYLALYFLKDKLQQTFSFSIQKLD